MKKENKNIDIRYIVIGILTVLLVLAIFQSVQIARLTKEVRSSTIQMMNAMMGEAGSKVINKDILPKGVAEVYGDELGVSFDDVSASNPRKADETIAKLARLDNEIQLTGSDLERYINIAEQISCEYCCGAESVIFTRDIGQYKAGDAACGCAHSYALRGLAKYLISNHPELSDEEILEELGKWKTLFFPDIMSKKAAILQSKGIELNYINLASNKYRGIEYEVLSGSSGMVGGC